MIARAVGTSIEIPLPKASRSTAIEAGRWMSDPARCLLRFSLNHFAGPSFQIILV